MDDYFKTTDIANIKITPEQKNLIGKDIQFVKGSDFYKGYYEENLVHKINIRYFQLAIFDEHGKRAVRSYLFEGTNSKGACFYDYKIIEIKNYRISAKDLDKFVEKIQNQKSQNNNGVEFKVMFKWYPVYNFDYTNPPEGNELSQCQSELLNY
jgi:hypothetical protein